MRLGLSFWLRFAFSEEFGQLLGKRLLAFRFSMSGISLTGTRLF